MTCYSDDWPQFHRFFEEYGNIWVGSPEMRWYEEAWGAVARAIRDESDSDSCPEVALKLQSICLVNMYHSFCTAFGEGPCGHSFSDMADSLGIDSDDIADASEPSGSESDEPEALFEDAVMEKVWAWRERVFETLLRHFGGESFLFVALWNSMRPQSEVESANAILSCGLDPEKLTAFQYVSEGMANWR